VNALCKVQISKKDRHKTSEVRSLNPEWNEEFKVYARTHTPHALARVLTTSFPNRIHRDLAHPFEAVEAFVWVSARAHLHLFLCTALLLCAES
jgi:hypothetical protein